MEWWRGTGAILVALVASACGGGPGLQTDDETSGDDGDEDTSASESLSGESLDGTDQGTSGSDDGTDSGNSDCPAPEEVRSLIADLAAPVVDPDASPGKAVGLMVGVTTQCDRYVVGLGATEIGGSTAPEPDSIFEIASLSKVYTGYLLARGIDAGEVDMRDTIDATFPMGAPSYQGEPIDLLDLATHTSGLPNYPGNLPNPGPVNPSVGYTLEMLTSFLSTYSLPRAPGAQYEYSNLGSGILGYVLMTAAGLRSFEDLVQREIAEPYGLPDTAVALEPEQAARKVQGHAEGRPAPALEIAEPLQGGGALHSTVLDVLEFFEGAVFGDDPAWAMVMVPRRDSPNGVDASTGFMLNIEPSDTGTIYSKSGGAPGFSSQVVFTDEPPAVVVLLSNTNSTQGLNTLGRAILEAMAELE